MWVCLQPSCSSGRSCPEVSSRWLLELVSTTKQQMGKGRLGGVVLPLWDPQERVMRRVERGLKLLLCYSPKDKTRGAEREEKIREQPTWFSDRHAHFFLKLFVFWIWHVLNFINFIYFVHILWTYGFLNDQMITLKSDRYLYYLNHQAHLDIQNIWGRIFLFLT